jgi:hypothetical protein
MAHCSSGTPFEGVWPGVSSVIVSLPLAYLGVLEVPPGLRPGPLYRILVALRNVARKTIFKT